MKKVVTVLAVLAVLAGGAYAFRELGTWLSVADPVQEVDIAVVVAGDPDQRVPAALRHLDAGRADRVWVVVSPEGPVLEERRAIRNFVEERGAERRVEIVGRAETHRGTASVIARRLASRRPAGETSVGVITSPWSLTRDRVVFSRFLGGRADVSVWSDGSPYAAERWWTRDAAVTGVEAVKLIGDLALLGARPVGAEGEVPLRLPLRALGAGFLVALAAGAVCRPLARRLGLVAHPRLFRAHAYPVPLLGGLAILAGLGGGVVAGGGFAVGAAGAVAAGGVVVLALVGFVDDLIGLGARSRVVWAALAGGAAWLLGLRAQIFGPGVGGEVGDALITVLWFVGVTHAVNLLDNTDGAAAGVGAASAAAIAGIAVTGGQWVVGVGAAALAGACIGYLVHNMHPARLFMGDLGALGVGFALAALALALRPEVEEPLSFSVAVFVLGVPIFDTVLVTISRVRTGRPVSTGGTDHPAHRLIAYGFGVRASAAMLWGAQAVLGAAAYAVATAGSAVWGWTVSALVGATGLVALVIFLRLPAWRPQRAERPAGGVVEAIERTLGPLRAFVRTGRENGLTTADPQTMRAAEETLERLERARELLREDG